MNRHAAFSFAALIVGLILIPTALGVAKQDHDEPIAADL
jgi:hypothetical protein